jgi:hypothetical protein
MKKFQMSLKLGGALLMALASLFPLPDRSSAQGNRKDSFTPPKPVVIRAEWGRKDLGCKGAGLCYIIIPEGPKTAAREVQAQLSTNADGKIAVDFLTKPPEEGPTLFIDEDIAAPPAIAAELGFKSVILLKGKYAYNSRRSVINARLVK